MSQNKKIYLLKFLSKTELSEVQLILLDGSLHPNLVEVLTFYAQMQLSSYRG